MSSLLRQFPPERRGIALGWRQLAVPMGGTIGAAALPLLAHVGGVRLALIVTAFATASTASVFAWLSAAGGGTARRMRLDGALTARGMRPLLVVGLLYVYALGASLTYIVAAARDDGLGKAEAGALFVVLNLSAAASRLVWGRMADRGGGTRRVRTLIECGMLAAWRGWRWRRCCTSDSCWPCPSPSRSASAALAGTACCTSPPASWSAPTGPRARWAWHRPWCSVPARWPLPSRGWWPSTPATT